MNLQELLTLQHDLQRKLNVNPLEMNTDQKIEYIRWNVLALTSELHEALNETTWKPWTFGDRVIYQDRVIAELVDALHFLLNLLLAAAPEGAANTERKIEILADIVESKYTHKRERNIQRSVDNYDGTEDKCPTCKRDLIDVTPYQINGLIHCGGCGALIPKKETI